MLSHVTEPVRDEEEDAGRGQAQDTDHYEEESTDPLGGEFRVGANGGPVSDRLAHLGQSKTHARVMFGDDPLGVGQRRDGEDVGQEEEEPRDDRQLVHGRWI